MAGFAGADYDLQDALVESTEKKTTTREADGQQFYDYELVGPVGPTSELPGAAHPGPSKGTSMRAWILTMGGALCMQTNNYLATVTLKQGKVYAFFVKSPAKVSKRASEGLLPCP